MSSTGDGEKKGLNPAAGAFNPGAAPFVPNFAGAAPIGGNSASLPLSATEFIPRFKPSASEFVPTFVPPPQYMGGNGWGPHHMHPQHMGPPPGRWMHAGQGGGVMQHGGMPPMMNNAGFFPAGGHSYGANVNINNVVTANANTNQQQRDDASSPTLSSSSSASSSDGGMIPKPAPSTVTAKPQSFSSIVSTPAPVPSVAPTKVEAAPAPPPVEAAVAPAPQPVFAAATGFSASRTGFGASKDLNPVTEAGKQKEAEGGLIVYNKEFMLALKERCIDQPDSFHQVADLDPSEAHDETGGGGGGRYSGGGGGRDRHSGGGGDRRGRGGGGGGYRGRDGGKVAAAPPLPPVAPLELGENRWVPRVPTAEDEKIFKTVKGLLNKLTVEKFDKLSEQVLMLEITTADVLSGVVSLIHEKAMAEPKFSPIYADLCEKLIAKMPELEDSEGQTHTFRKMLLDVCQSEFNKEYTGPEDSLEGLDEEQRNFTEKKRRMRSLGNIEFVGELYKRKLLDMKIMHRCIRDLLAAHTSDVETVVKEEKIQCLCKLLSTVGKRIEAENEKSKSNVEMYYKHLEVMSVDDECFSSRIRFMLMDAIDLRLNNWVPRQKTLAMTSLSAVQEQAQKEQRSSDRAPRTPDKRGGPGRDRDRRGRDGGRGGGGGGNRSSPKDRSDSRFGSSKDEDEWETVSKPKKPQQQVAGRGSWRGGGGGGAERGRFDGGGFGARRGGREAASTTKLSNNFGMLGADDDDNDDDDESEEEEKAPLPPKVKSRLRSSLDEYLTNPDLEEAKLCARELQELGVDSETLILEAISMAIGKSESASISMVSYIEAMKDSEIVSGVDVVRGFAALCRDLDEVCVDAPLAGQHCAVLAGALSARGVLSPAEPGLKSVWDAMREAETLAKFVKAAEKAVVDAKADADASAKAREEWQALVSWSH